MNKQMQKSNEYWIYDQKCKKLIEIEEIRFAGLINKMGHLVAERNVIATVMKLLTGKN